VVNIEDVARLAAVGRSTVSNVMNRPHIVAPATRQRVLDAMENLGFVPNESARVLAGGPGRFVGVVVHDASNPFFGEIIRTVEDAALNLRYIVSTTNTGADPVRESTAVELLIQQRASGVLITPSALPADALGRLRRIGTKVVVLDAPGESGICSVAMDDTAGGRLAGQHFLDYGYRSFAFVGTPARTTQHAARLAGFRAALEESPLGRRLDVQVIEVAHEDIASGRQAAERLQHRDSPVAVLCGNDLIAMGLSFALQERGTVVPQDVAICGYDDIDMVRYLSVPLTTVRQPVRDMARTALDLLVEEMRSPEHEHQAVLFAPELKVRASTARQ
jgi:LacI family transcriptional regulator